MKQIPRMQAEDREINQLQVNILSVLNPIFKANPMLFGNTLQNVELVVGNNYINTGLSRELQGWYVVRQRAFASIYDLQDSNTAAGTLLLVSNAAVSIDLVVY